VASGVLCQRSGPTWRPIGYYSKVLDPVAKGWPACLRAVAATALLVQEAEKLTLGGDTEVVVCCGPSVSNGNCIHLGDRRARAKWRE
uniref:Reverse transcriptase RNase H-like domain-containing protein n=1 Tax=Chrysemys picta bellii TaxID=8478 RepID=A0A8C3FEV2_CHRPI